MTTFNLTCAAVEATLADYLDETLEPWVRNSIDEHLASCVHCSSLARELRNITRETAALPALLPDDDVWPRIAGRIGAPVVVAAAAPESETAIPMAEPVTSASEIVVPISEENLVGSEPPSTLTEELVPPIELLPTASEESVPIELLPTPTEESVFPAEPTVVASEPALAPSEAVLLPSEPGLPPTGSASQSTEQLPITEAVPLPSEPVPSPVSPPVLTIAAADAEPARRQQRWGREWLGLAAAALVLVTAGTTFLLTVRWIGRPGGTANVASAANTRRSSSSEKASSELRTRGRAPEREQVTRDSLGVVRDSLALHTQRDGQLPSVLAVEATSAAPTGPSPEDVVYDREINVLQKIVARHNADLDTSTAAVIDRNLGTLDSAIAQIRTALKKDPSSSLLDGQASRALQMKVELLRRAAMMRSNSI
jgi:hypothetical protein